ncbi:MAG: preprotein translocase subunit YajC [Hyphomonadaceae bacterium]|nr:preprotein translocase subunit YajC [Clostridia bacterium]
MVLVIYAAIFAVFYFMLIAPQRKRTKKEAQMRANVKVGDEIVTSGGIYGKVLQIKDDTLVIEVNADKGKLRIAKWAIQEVKQLISE